MVSADQQERWGFLGGQIITITQLLMGSLRKLVISTTTRLARGSSCNVFTFVFVFQYSLRVIENIEFTQCLDSVLLA